MIIWTLSISIHESGLISYYEITGYTWSIILYFQLIYISGCLLGKRLSKFYFKSKYKKRDFNERRILLLKWIIIFSVISAISIIPHVVTTIRTYGVNIFENSSTIYFDSISDSDTTGIFNLAGLSAVAITFAGIYVSEFGFNKIILFPLSLAILDQLSNGSRGFLINCLLLFLAPILIKLGNKNNKDKSNLIKNKFSIRTKIVILLPIIILLFMTVSRNANLKDTFIELPYASEFLRDIGNNNNIIYSVVFYLSGPIAALNEYLKNMKYGGFGVVSFRLLYQILGKLGMVSNDIPLGTAFIGTFYTPVPSNVVSYIGFLIYEFKIFGALIATFMAAFVFSFSYVKSIKNNSLFYKTVFSVFYTLFTFSFFASYFGTSYIIYTLFIGSLIAYFIDYRIIK